MISIMFYCKKIIDFLIYFVKVVIFLWIVFLNLKNYVLYGYFFYNYFKLIDNSKIIILL